MSKTSLSTFLHHLKRGMVAETLSDAGDPQLVEQFLADRDEAAFEALIRRHGPMIMSVCSRIVHNHADAEDAFQATFLVLAKNLRTVRKQASFASWLHGVARRIALKARAQANTRRQYEQRVPLRESSGAEDITGKELRSVFDEELTRLPDKWRLPLILCYLEGRTQEEAAKQLGWSKNTLRRRLDEARARLGGRLRARDAAWPAAFTAVLVSDMVSSAALRPKLIGATVEAVASISANVAPATAVVSTNVAALSEGVFHIMTLTRLSTFGVVILVLATAGVVAGGLAQSRPALERNVTAGEADTSRREPEQSAAPDKAQADLLEMRGTWSVATTETSVQNGELLPPKEVKVIFVISGDKLIMLGQDGFIDQEWTLKLDPAQKPKAVDGTNAGLGGAFPGIYELTGDTLKINFSYERVRPTSFPAHETMWNLKRVSRTPHKTVARFANAPGCFWIVEPNNPSASCATQGVVFIHEKDRDGAAVITLAGALAGGSPPQYRPVLFDANKKRYLPKSNSSGGSSGRLDGSIVTLSRWRMDPKVLPDDKVAKVGIEAITAESHRFTALEAGEEARKLGLEVLPYPEVGKAFDFTLTTIEGKQVRSGDLRGKVVIIDCWATWCAPCMMLLPEVKELYEKHHQDGLEVIGMSLDDDVAKVKKTCERMSLNWPQVIVSTDEKQRSLWYEAAGIRSLPSVFVIDRDGILRADTTLELTELIEGLLKKSPAGVKK
jgi:RNA polymerase sigma factor (sigma-70 family)